MSVTIKTNGMAEAENEVKNTAAQSGASTEVNADKSGTAPSAQASGNTGAGQSGVPEAVQAEGAEVKTAKPTDFSKINTQYEGKYDEQLAELYNQITQRKPFEYSTEEDKLYQQYVDRYTKGGRLAMEDTMSRAAALTGGYGNTYAQQLGQQSYDEYMTGLADKALELRNLAYQQYRDEGADLRNNYAMLDNMDDKDYSRWGDGFDRAMAEAALRANSGDFDPYRQLYGEDAARRMQQNYAATVLMPLYNAKQIDAETYKEIAGVYPVGYVEPGTGTVGGGGVQFYGSWKNGGSDNYGSDGKKEPSFAEKVAAASYNGATQAQITATSDWANATPAERSAARAEWFM